MSRKTFVAESQLDHLLREPNVLVHKLNDDGTFPNSKLPLLFYRGAVLMPEQDPAGVFEGLFRTNGWSGSWRDGIYSYHHYHSTAHEVIGIYRGSAKVQLGGDKGLVLEVRPGDVIVIPAGVAHMNLGSTRDFGVVGAYPEGQDWDMNYGQPSERPRADRNLRRVALPKTDPVYSVTGPLLSHWTG